MSYSLKSVKGVIEGIILGLGSKLSKGGLDKAIYRGVLLRL